MPGINYVRDLTPALWIRSRLHPFAQDAGSVVPEGFDSYARVFHPATRDDKPVTWHAIAEANNRKVHPEMQFGSIASTWRESPRPDVWTSPPPTGRLPTALAVRLAAILRQHTTTPERIWFAVWEGWGGLDPGTPRFDHPGRRYYLAKGALDEPDTAAQTPFLSDEGASMWWPEDRSWFVATEVDLDSTYVGATKECIEAVIASHAVEALRARLDDDITIVGDEINPPVPLP